MAPAELIFIAGAALLVVGVFLAAYAALSTPTSAVSEQGERGYQRQRARHRVMFSLMEPLMRLFAAWVACLPLGGLRGRLDDFLRRAGYPWGLEADELVALCSVTGAMGAAVALPVYPVPFVVIGMVLLMGGIPIALVSSAKEDRTRHISRALPFNIELIALCVSAGMDLPGALREILADDPSEDDPLQREFRQILRDLDLGHSRKRTLRAFADRIDNEGVNDFAAAIIQSEERGTPLKEVLEAQAKVLHLRRSFTAEVLAAQAAVKLVIPLAMLMLAVLLVVGAPLFLRIRIGDLGGV